MARREEEEYSTYCDDEQRGRVLAEAGGGAGRSLGQPGCIDAQNHNRYLQAAP
jgi:hypothetical protein